ncbi:DUF5996 family protein [Hoeflea sp.]|uniref:DUF5996 family protein n=1 Tax=Hoeflea sp. TaxID=1940281 RepID=UPI003B01FCB1
MSDTLFPALPYGDWVQSKETLHLFLQMIGKVRMASHPKQNHWWHVTLYPSARGLTTGRIAHPSGGFQIDYDFIDHTVRVLKNDGRMEQFDVPGLSVAGFHDALFSALGALGIDVTINTMPYDNVSKTPFEEDHARSTYDAEAVSRYWQALCSIASVFETYRGGFYGKQTPAHLYWHSFDLAVTRFSGAAAPLENARTNSDREAYSHEVISVGFWPGDDSFQQAAFYGYAYPEPEGMNTVVLKPASALWAEKNGGALAVLAYDDMRQQADPAGALLSFLDSVYEGAAQKAGWDSGKFDHIYKDSA